MTCFFQDDNEIYVLNPRFKKCLNVLFIIVAESSSKYRTVFKNSFV